MFVKRHREENDDHKEDYVLHYFSLHSVLVYEAIITSGTFILLGGLTLWHARLISSGETSIEAHINKSETKRLSLSGQTYKNPFDFGPYHNWCLFLGIIEGRSIASVLFPSKHLPRGDGFQWDSVYSCGVKWNDIPQLERFDPAKLA
jgi:palmitoyltransferase